MKDIVISLFDRTGNWSRPWFEAGYTVYQIDIQNGIQTDIMTWQYRRPVSKGKYITDKGVQKYGVYN